MTDMNQNQRVIKFRVWAPKHSGGHQFYHTSSHASLNGEGYDHLSFHLQDQSLDMSQMWGNEAYDPNLTIQQFTGLHDTNGREIYEGDIVEFNHKQDACYGSDNFTKGEIVWFDTFFGLAGKSVCPLHHLFNNGLVSVEVIGNIFETPGLLNTNQ